MTPAFYFLQILVLPQSWFYPSFSLFISLLFASFVTEILRFKGSLWSFGIIFDRAAYKNIFVGLGLAVFAMAIFMIFHVFSGSKITFSGFQFRPFYYLFFVLLFFATAASEELFFRGVIFQAFFDAGHKYLSAFILSILFSLVHILNHYITLLGLINIFIVGLLLSYMFIETLSLWLPVSFHFFWNFLQEALLDSAVSGYRTGINLFVIEKNFDSGLALFLTGGEFGLEAGFLTTLILLMMFAFVHHFSFYSAKQAANMFRKRYYESLFITNNKLFR